MSEIQRYGTIGGGQLGLMTGRELQGYDLDLRFMDPGGLESPVALEGYDCMQGGLKDPDAIAYFVHSVGRNAVFGYEIEHIAVEPIKQLVEEGYDFQASPYSLEVIQNKLRQKAAFVEAGLPIAEFLALNGPRDLLIARNLFGKVIAKAAEGGYDGRGNYVPEPDESYEDIVAKLGGQKAGPLLVEKYIDFDRELSVVGVRGADGEIALYPVVQTVHEDNICHTVYAPADLDPQLTQDAQELGRDTINVFEGRGVFAVEMILTKDGKLLINEIAPRVHNSAHWTLNGAVTSQFENHGRALLKLPLGSTKPLVTAPATVMVNILHARMPAEQQPEYASSPYNALHGQLNTLVNPDKLPNINLHTYTKLPRENGDARKIAHFNVIASTLAQAMRLAKSAHDRVNEDYLASLEV